LLDIYLHSIIALSQTTVKGRITDAETHEALESAAVYLHNGKKHTFTNIDGYFELEVSDEFSILNISYIGYQDTSLIVDISLGNFNIEIELHRLTIEMRQVLVTASRKLQQKESTATSSEIVATEEIEIQPVTNIDNVLQGIANVYVNRSWGIFSKNASVTMRGMDGKDRVLILLDGIPLNKAAGGSINWHLITPERIERIEVLKGPSSAIYGNNAMNGVINLISKLPQNKLELLIKASLASYNTYSGNITIGSKLEKDNKAFYYNLNGYYRKGDGYYFTPVEIRDTLDAKLFLEEYNSTLKLGYDFNKHNNIELNYTFHHDMRGAGRQVYEEFGSYDSYRTHLFALNYAGKINKTVVHLNAFLQNELYLKQSENISGSNKYKLSESPQISGDYGVMSSFSTRISQRHELTYGFDGKIGQMLAEDIYRTSTDYIERKGSLFFGGIYLQDEWKLHTKFQFISGIRVDYARFYDGALTVRNPTSETGFTESYNENFKSNEWHSFSPKIALNYLYTDKINAYISIAKGFRPPAIDDLCSSRKITKGFKIANPKLLPEDQITYELGFTFSPIENIIIQSAIYYTQGYNFQYFVETGDSVDTGGSSLKPVLIRENITKIDVRGFEIALTYKLKTFLTVKANYTHNNSKIIEFDLKNYNGTNLENSYLIETPANQAYIGVFGINKWINFSCVYNYIGEQWADDENLFYIDGYQTVDIGLSRNIGRYLNLSLDIQNIMNVKFVDKKGYESPGRFIVFELGFML